MGCCLSGDQETDRNGSRGEDHPLLHAPQKEFRHERSEGDFNKHKTMKNILQCLCRSLCLYIPSGWGLIFSFILALICIFQLVYDLFVVCGCPGFDCGFLVKTIEAKPNASVPHRSSFRKTSNTVYTLASVGGLFSYTLLLISLMLILNRRRKYGNKAIGPSDALYEDLTNTQIKIIFTSQVILTFLFVSAVVLFGILVRDQPRDGWYFYLMITGVAAQFIAQWAAIVGCHVFSISSLSLGTLANDTIRRIRKMTKDQSKRDGKRTSYQSTETRKGSDAGQQKQNPDAIESHGERDDQKSESTSKENFDKSTNSFDVALGYHEELCDIVSDTVSAYCPWFVMHWFCYGATCLIGVIYISEELTYSKNIIKLAYVNVFLVTHLYMFLLPCCCAAYITDTCGGIYSRINKTTSKYWEEGHPFKDRNQLSMFTAYAKDRQCVFKIGRLTFTSTLAWISLLLGSTGLLFHFF